MMNKDSLSQAKAFIKTHFIKSEFRVCKLRAEQLAKLISSASNEVELNAYTLEYLLKSLGYRQHIKTGWYMMKLSPRLLEYAKDRLGLFN